MGVGFLLPREIFSGRDVLHSRLLVAFELGARRNIRVLPYALGLLPDVSGEQGGNPDDEVAPLAGEQLTVTSWNLHRVPELTLRIILSISSFVFMADTSRSG